MKIGVTGATGFLGRYILEQLSQNDYTIRAWWRRKGKVPFDLKNCEWIEGELEHGDSYQRLAEGCEAVVHAALALDSGDWSGEVNFRAFLEKNLLGTLLLIEECRRAGVKKFIFVSSCAVHEKILPEHRLDELHPLYPASHYGAYKAAVEAFVHSFALGHGFDASSIRPCGIYGLAEPPSDSKWFKLIRAIMREESIHCERGGKEVHAEDVAKAIRLIAEARNTAGEVFNCYDRYISDWEVAHIAKRMCGSSSPISGRKPEPKNQIETAKIRSLGMEFGGEALLEKTVSQMIEAVRNETSAGPSAAHGAVTGIAK